jgi:cell wall-associated NlpC family hydrolase
MLSMFGPAGRLCNTLLAAAIIIVSLVFCASHPVSAAERSHHHRHRTDAASRATDTRHARDRRHTERVALSSESHARYRRRHSETIATSAESGTRHHKRRGTEIASQTVDSSAHYRRRRHDELAGDPFQGRHRQHRGSWMAFARNVRHHVRSFSLYARACARAREADLDRQTRALYSGDVAEAAQAFEGTRYVFGGTSRSGFDCSGFTRFILGHSAGINLPRTAMEQFEDGIKVSVDQLHPGDLVFFANTYRRGISHVGIYVGNGRFVHACSTEYGVRTDSLSSPYYYEHFAGARRVIFDRESSER